MERKIHGWVVKDEYGDVLMFRSKPHRAGHVWLPYLEHEEGYCMDEELFPDLTWEDEPLEIELTITSN